MNDLELNLIAHARLDDLHRRADEARLARSARATLADAALTVRLIARRYASLRPVGHHDARGATPRWR